MRATAGARPRPNARAGTCNNVVVGVTFQVKFLSLRAVVGWAWKAGASKRKPNTILKFAARWQPAAAPCGRAHCNNVVVGVTFLVKCLSLRAVLGWAWKAGASKRKPNTILKFAARWQPTAAACGRAQCNNVVVGVTFQVKCLSLRVVLG